MYYRIISFEIDPHYEAEFLSIADSFRRRIKSTDEHPFIDFLKTGERKAMIIITYESEDGVHRTDENLRRMWFKLQRSKFIAGPLSISEGIVSWML